MEKQHITNSLLIILTLVLSWVLPGCTDRQFPVQPPDGSQSAGPTLLNAGSISGNLTFQLSPYIVDGNLTIDSLKSLTIEPGVIIQFVDSGGLYIKGQLNCTGNADNPVLFTANKNSWKGIVISGSTGTAKIQYTIFEKISISSQTDGQRNGSVEIIDSKATIRNSIFRNNRSENGGALYLSNSSSVITNNIFMNNFAAIFGGAILSSGSSNQFINNTFYTNEAFNYGGGLVLISPVFEEIQNNIFYQNTNKTGDPSVAVNGLLTDSTRYLLKYNFLRSGISGPAFLSAQNLRLSLASPCIDAGNPDPKFNDTNGSRNDQGAFGGPYGNW